MSLPNELWLWIAEYSSVRTVLNLLQVNTHFYHLINPDFIRIFLNKLTTWAEHPSLNSNAKKQIRIYRTDLGQEVAAVNTFLQEHDWKVPNFIFWNLALEFTKYIPDEATRIRRFLLIHAFYKQSNIQALTWWHFVVNHERDYYLRFSLQAFSFDDTVQEKYLYALFEVALEEKDVKVARIIYQYNRVNKYRQGHALWYVHQKGYSLEFMYRVCLPSPLGEYCWSTATPQKQFKFTQKILKYAREYNVDTDWI